MKKKLRALLVTARRAWHSPNLKTCLRRLLKKSPKAESQLPASAPTEHKIDLNKPNVSRFFVVQRHISWVMLIAVCVWGVYSYRSMPQRKDPDTPVKTAVAITTWPGASAEQIEQLVTKKVEEKIAQNANVEKIRSISRTNFSAVRSEEHV